MIPVQPVGARTGPARAGSESEATTGVWRSTPGTIDLRVLGPIELILDGVAQQLPGVKPRALLAVLLLHRNRIVPSSVIADAIWNDDPPAAFAGSLQVFMSNLRRTLRGTTTDFSTIITTAAPGYRLSIPEQHVDLARFERASAVGRELQAAGRHAEASARYRAALAEWSGSALGDLQGFRFADEFAAVVEDERVGILQARIDADLACGRESGVVGELTSLTAQFPLREPFWAQLAIAYYRMGRQADALDAIRRLRSVLAEELGIDPGRDVQDLERKILQHETLLDRVPRNATTSLLQTQAEDPSPEVSARLVLATGQAVDVSGAGLRIGRMDDNDLVLDSVKVSRHHATVVLTETGFAISDLRSTNGTFVNGLRVLDSRLLEHGDEIGIGGLQLRYEMG